MSYLLCPPILAEDMVRRTKKVLARFDNLCAIFSDYRFHGLLFLVCYHFVWSTFV